MGEIDRLLKEKRLELGLTTEKVNDQTRLTQKHIKVLEEGDIGFFHDDLSYPHFFVKSYCDMLGLDLGDVKDKLRKDVSDYTMTFTISAQINHEEVEKNIAKSEKLSKVSTANVKTRQKRRFHKPDMSLVSLIAIVAIVAIVIMFAFVVFLELNAGKGKAANNTQPTAPEQTESGTNKYPSSDEKKGEEGQQREEEKEINIFETNTTHYTIENLKDEEDLKFKVTFVGSSSGFSTSVDGRVLDEPKAQVYEYRSSAKGTVKAKEDMKLELYVGYIYNTQLKVNDKNVKLDDSIVNSSGAITLEFTIAGGSDESSK